MKTEDGASHQHATNTAIERHKQTNPNESVRRMHLHRSSTSTSGPPQTPADAREPLNRPLPPPPSSSSLNMQRTRLGLEQRETGGRKGGEGGQGRRR